MKLHRGRFRASPAETHGVDNLLDCMIFNIWIKNTALSLTEQSIDATTFTSGVV